MVERHKNSMTRRRLVARLRKVELGHLGDVEVVGEGVREMREHFGAGWRMYFVQQGDVLIVMLRGGNKPRNNVIFKKPSRWQND